MNALAKRGAHTGPAWVSVGKRFTNREFFQETLEAVKALPGLAHEKFRDDETGERCALGAFAERQKDDEVIVDTGSALELTEFNDSMPQLSQAERRAKVIEWLEAKLA